MSLHHPKDRASLCLFTFTDGRRCRTPRTTGHPHFCFYHARKETQARVAEKLGNDLNFFLSGEYLSANDLSAALGRIIPPSSAATSNRAPPPPSPTSPRPSSKPSKSPSTSTSTLSAPPNGATPSTTTSTKTGPTETPPQPPPSPPQRV
jgi:hypothetical protein